MIQETKPLETCKTTHWVVLRCVGQKTLDLVNDLKKLGIPSWTPVGKKRGRQPRSRKYYDKTFALMPSYVFASAEFLTRIQWLASNPVKHRVSQFTIMQRRNHIPKIQDIQLMQLREEEDKFKIAYAKQVINTRRGNPKFQLGEQVKFDEGSFEGLVGKVIEQKTHFTLVSIEGFKLPIKVDPHLLKTF